MDLKEARATDDADRVASATLKELGDIRIDDVLSFIDRGIEKMPSYMDLYRRWRPASPGGRARSRGRRLQIGRAHV